MIIGTSRGVGRCLLERALAQHHHVTAAIRNPAAVDIHHDRLHVVPYDVLDADSVTRALAGQDVVFCTIGDKSRGPTTLYSTAARNIVRAMQAHQVRRLVYLWNFGVLGETAQDLRGAALLFLAKRVIRHTLADHRRALEEIQNHAPEWIAVRPLPLTNGSWTGQYRAAVDGLPAKSSHIARADVADFLLRQATENSYLNKARAIAY
ncbi:NAD(P)-dependent oxidoreductase [Microvirga sesbaniae]|uniref:NAD(P)-dependent oxidoreductase n=1 Tax=Microvirga sesbaniae TaxID=681392 RepID=UPI0021C8B171|nr:NAD(P)H-binding protein [Microvirga sp. HBU67692]